MISVWKDLVIALLSIYGYSLEKVDSFAPGLEQQGLFDPVQLVKMSHEDIFKALEKGGYKRGELNGIFTDRLLALGAFIQTQGQASAEKILKGKDAKKIEAVLMPIKGVGPKVIDNYLLLRGLKS